ncbi:hypothetical protein VIGAN_08256000 [Vigna angularis var. angularis]|uniref:Uncharacterized protein n=1 Tax=Vigna angularis var. angularis TaxID=157739 RepID=A0A0S3SSK1_PHAAN|nr:hypothetical protein VIGAN_08256000 [Vigna angularis var. angularis]
MSTEKDNADTSDNTVQASSSVNNPSEKWQFGRAVAYRAVYGFNASNHRKGKCNAAKILPSRLSKVSVSTGDTNDK